MSRSSKCETRIKKNKNSFMPTLPIKKEIEYGFKRTQAHVSLTYRAQCGVKDQFNWKHIYAKGAYKCFKSFEK